jgi:hypothetical protein
VLVLELLALVLTIPGVLASLRDLFGISLKRSGALLLPHTARSRTAELDITLRLHVRRTSAGRHLSARDRHLS